MPKIPTQGPVTSFLMKPKHLLRKYINTSGNDMFSDRRQMS